MYYGHHPTFIGKTKIKNLYNWSGRGWSWDVEDETGTNAHYRTNRDGEGLWIVDLRDGSESQLMGTCQFALTQTTDSGRRKYIRRYF